MNTGVITLQFNEPLNISTIQFMEVTLEQARSAGLEYTLNGGNLITMSNEEVIQFQILDDDLNELKRLQIGSSRSTSFVTFSGDFIRDIFNNSAVGVTQRPATGYIPDETPPVLSNFHLDLTAETLELFFSETVRARSLDVTQITLQDQSASVMYTLTDASMLNSTNATSIVVRLGRDDLNQIKLELGLATTESNSYLSYTSTAIVDMFGNLLVNRSMSDALLVSNFTNDFKPPRLEGFSLDLSNETLVLSFSESVNASSFRADAVTIQRDTLSPAISVSLTDGSVGANNFELEVQLQTPDLNIIKQFLDLGTAPENTFVSISSELIRDLNGNSIEAISNSSALMADIVVPDFVAPALQGFLFNLNESTLTLNFTETISVPTLDVQGIVLQDDFNSTNSYVLTFGEVQRENSSIVYASPEAR